jgi:hypothetical protein
MMGSREGFRERRRRKKAARDRLAEKAEMVRAETRARAEERAAAEEREKAETKARAKAEAEAQARAEAKSRERKEEGKEPKAAEKPRRRRASKESRRRRRRRRRSLSRRERLGLHRAQLDDLWVWTKGVGPESRRRAKLGWANGRRRAEPALARTRKWLQPVLAGILVVLRPLWRGIRAVLAPIAPFISAALFAVIRAVGWVLSAMLAVLSWTSDRIVGAARAVARWVDAHVTPARTFAGIAGAAAVALAVSQFIDYRATAIGGEQYSGEVGTVAPVPRIDQEPAGDPHLYVLLPLAIAALVLTWLALRGRRRLGLWVAAIGAVGVLVTLAVDLPQGLDTGRVGDAYEGTEAHLIEGFWTQLIASLVLVGSGLALSRSSDARRDPSRERDLAAGPETPPGSQGPGQAAGWGAGA